MARAKRICPAGIPLHIVQRGNNRQRCFCFPNDYRRYLAILAKSCERYAVQVHAYVLMSNHVHLLITPAGDDSASRLMQNLGRCYVQTFNRIYDRTGTLWEGRFRSFPIDTERYLLACYRYIELNPVRAGLVNDPAAYRWSSYRTNALGKPSNVLSPRPEWIELGGDDAARCLAYRQLFADDLDESTLARIRADILGVRAGL